MGKFGKYLLANPLHALVFALFCALLPLVSVPGGFFAAIVIGLVTLCQGYKTGFLVLLGVAIPIVALLLWKGGSLFDLMLIRCGLVWLLAGILRSTGSWRLMLEMMTVIGFLVVLGFYLVVPDVSVWWLGWLKKYGVYLGSLLTDQIAEDKLQLMLKEMVPIATGLFATLVLLGVLCQLLAARWWQAAMFRPGGLAKEFVEIRNSQWIAIGFAITLIFAWIGIDFAIDLLPVLIMPFVIEGISLLHKWSRVKKEIIFLLVMVYIGLLFLPMIFIVVLALAGYIDCWYDLRKRFFRSSH